MNNNFKLFCISDTHGLHHVWNEQFSIPNVDVIIHSGDISNVGKLNEINDFIIWFDSLDVKHKIFIAGNHDFGFENYDRSVIKELISNTSIHYLEDCEVIIDGIKFWGSPVTPPFFNWAFMRDSEKIKQHWDAIPDDVDVLITHGPPQNILDFTRYGNLNVGCPILLENVLNRVKPKYHIFGHLHESYGIEENNGVTFVNASVLNEKYRPVREGHILNI